MAQEDFINDISKWVLSWKNFFNFGVASAIIAQACLESGFGTSGKAKDHHNYFGLKYKKGRVNCNDGYFTDTSREQLPDGSYITISTKWFNFIDMNAGVDGYYQFIQSGRYKVEGITDPRAYLQALKDGGYATSINYVDNCMRVIETYNLTRFDGEKMYTNSPLVEYIDLSPWNYGPRSAVDGITIHHMAGNLSVETCGKVFHKKKGNSNYGIGTDGRCAMYVEEKNGAYTSSNKANDMRMITIEVANNTLAPYWTVSDRAMNKLILLCADICRRNGIKKLVWSGSKSDRINHKNGANMTLHCDFASTACPGPYLKQCMPYIANAVNNLLVGPTPSGYIINGYDYSPVFDPTYYANRYADLRTAFGSDAAALWNHFTLFGMNELRRGNADFDPVYYKNKYVDLREAYGDDNPMYYYHWIVFGKAEGRDGHA